VCEAVKAVSQHWSVCNKPRFPKCNACPCPRVDCLRAFTGGFWQWSPMNHLLSWKYVNTVTFVELMVCLSFLCNACLCAVGLRFVVARTKKCWDFGATMYIFHAIVASVYSGFPFSWMWWALMATCAIVTVLLGELLCARYEMAEIPVQGMKLPLHQHVHTMSAS
jgi:Integral membrane protein S linking to the trans Golgi network